MSTSTEITRIQNARNTIRTKLVSLGLAEATDKLDELATEIDDITDRGTVDASVREGESYTVQPGYYKGGTVKGVAGGGNYSLQTPADGVTPTTSQQVITPDSGYYGLASVTVKPIPSNYKDISSTTAQPSDVLANKIFIDKNGETQAGMMDNNGAVSKTLDATTNNQSYAVPSGYHNGSGTVSIVLEQKTGASGVTPTKSAQTVTPTVGKVLSAVEVKAIPDAYQDISEQTATPATVAASKKIILADGTLADGTLAENGDVSVTIDGLTTTSATIPAGITTGGTVSLTNAIELALAAI